MIDDERDMAMDRFFAEVALRRKRRPRVTPVVGSEERAYWWQRLNDGPSAHTRNLWRSLCRYAAKAIYKHGEGKVA